jgi:hypothetical protein
MPSARTKLRELAILARDDADALRDTLREDAEFLGAALGVSQHELRALAERDDANAGDRVRRLLDHARRHSTDQGSMARERRATSAARELGLTARWLDVGAEIDPRILLGDLLADGSKPWIGFMVDGADVIVSRATLRRAAIALKPLPEVRGFIDAQALRLRWRAGRGGLNLRAQASDIRDPALVLRVVLERPRAQPAPVVTPTRPSARPPPWLADVIAELVS